MGKLGGVSYIPESCRKQTYEESEREKKVVNEVRFPKTWRCFSFVLPTVITFSLISTKTLTLITYLILHEKLGSGLGCGLSRSVAIPAGNVSLRLHEHVVLQLLLEGRLLRLQRLLQHIQLLAR